MEVMELEVMEVEVMELEVLQVEVMERDEEERLSLTIMILMMKKLISMTIYSM